MFGMVSGSVVGASAAISNAFGESRILRRAPEMQVGPARPNRPRYRYVLERWFGGWTCPSKTGSGEVQGAIQAARAITSARGGRKVGLLQKTEDSRLTAQIFRWYRARVLRRHADA